MKERRSGHRTDRRRRRSGKRSAWRKRSGTGRRRYGFCKDAGGEDPQDFCPDGTEIGTFPQSGRTDRRREGKGSLEKGRQREAGARKNGEGAGSPFSGWRGTERSFCRAGRSVREGEICGNGCARQARGPYRPGGCEAGGSVPGCAAWEKGLKSGKDKSNPDAYYKA